MKKLDFLALLLLILGGINWGLWGVFDFNVVEYVLGRVWIDRVLYFLMGVSAVYFAVSWRGVKARISAKR